jgi:hypothetical protein
MRWGHDAANLGVDAPQLNDGSAGRRRQRSAGETFLTGPVDAERDVG